MRDKILDSINNSEVDMRNLVYFAILVAFLLGMIFGSTMHDSMFHAIEQSIEKARQS
jgi:hypothetical protein